MTPRRARFIWDPNSTYEEWNGGILEDRKMRMALWSIFPSLRRSNLPTCQILPMQRDLVTVERFYTEHAGNLQLHLVAGATGLKRLIREPTVNRPGLVLSGFTRYFAFKRIQAIGNAEAYFLKSLSADEQKKRYSTFFSYRIPCVVFSRNL